MVHRYLDQPDETDLFAMLTRIIPWFLNISCRGLCCPLYRLSRQRLPFTLAVLAYRFPRRTQATQRTALLSAGECVYNSRFAYTFHCHGLARGNLSNSFCDRNDCGNHNPVYHVFAEVNQKGWCFAVMGCGSGCHVWIGTEPL
jgi:hypothetical protein